MNASVPSTPRRPERTGYDASPERTLERVLPMLSRERVVWLSTVRPDGTPHLVPTWFWWDGSAILVFSKPGAVKVRNLRANPRLMVAVGDPEDDFDVGLIEANAAFVHGPADVPDAFFAKYATELSQGDLDARTYREQYTTAIRITPARFLAWRGRGEHQAPATAAIHAGVRAFRPATVAARLAAVLGRLLGPAPVPTAA